MAPKVILITDVVGLVGLYILRAVLTTDEVTRSPGNYIIRAGYHNARRAREETIRLWDISTGQLLQNVEGHGSSVYAVAFSSDSTQLVSSSRGNTIRLWDVATGQLCQTVEGYGSSVFAIPFLLDPKYMNISCCSILNSTGNEADPVH